MGFGDPFRQLEHGLMFQDQQGQPLRRADRKVEGVLCFVDAKSFRRKFFFLQNVLQVAGDFIFFTGRQRFGLYGLPGKLPVDLAVDLVADGQQRVAVAAFRYGQMIGKIVAQAADAPVEC